MDQDSTASSDQGRGMLAIFCDLEEKWRDEFRSWLAEDMFPARLAVGFPCCASYDAVPDMGGGTHVGVPEFLSLYEAPALADLYGEPYQALRRNRDLRDASFHERMMGMERYSLVHTGNDAGGGGFAPFVFVDRFDLRPEDVQAFNVWFVTEYLPWCAKLSGLIRVRRYLAMEGAPRHFILHEFEDSSFHEDAVWKALRNAKEWGLAGMTYGSPGFYGRAVQAP